MIYVFADILVLQWCCRLTKKYHKLLTANSDLSQQQKKLNEEITSLQSRLCIFPLLAYIFDYVTNEIYTLSFSVELMVKFKEVSN